MNSVCEMLSGLYVWYERYIIRTQPLVTFNVTSAFNVYI